MLYAWMEFVEREGGRERERGRIEGGTRRRRWDASTSDTAET